MLKKYLFFLSCILIISFFFSCKEKSTITNSDSFAISDTSIVTKIFLADRQGNTISLDKNNNEWIINNKYKVRKESIRILLETLNKIRIKRPVSLSAFDHIIRDLSTTGVKVEIYADDLKPLKIYTIGNETKDQLGTYMILHSNSSQESITEPFIMHIPGFNGYLAPRYGVQARILNEKTWRSRIIFDNSSIKNIRLKYLNQPELSFSLILSPTNLLDFMDNIIEHNNNAVIEYINRFSNLQCESFKSDVDIRNNIPLHEIIVNFDTLRTYQIASKEQKKKEENFNVERMYATLNNGEVMLIQNYVFNKVLITINELKK